MERLSLYHIDMKYVRDLHNAELHKIEVEGKLIGVLNFNLMIPVTDSQLMKVDLQIHNNDSIPVKAWKKLCIKELNWCRDNDKTIRDKAQNIYLLCTNEKQAFKGKVRCLDFHKLETV